MPFLVSVVVLAAVIVVFMLVERLYRSPGKPKWLDNESVVMPICVAFTGAIAGSVGAVIATALDLPLPFWGDIGVSVAAVVAIVLVVRMAFRAFAGARSATPA